MNVTAVLFGFLLGAVIGALVTSIRAIDLGYGDSAHRRGTLHAWRRSGAPPEPIGRIWQLFMRIFGLPVLGPQVKWLAVFVFAWILMSFCWMLASFTRVGLTLNSAWLRDGFTGSLVGLAAAPWIWLHFSHDFLSEEEREDPGAEQTRAEYLVRYRFLTVALGIMLLVLIFGPRLADLLRHANKVDILGVSVSTPERGGGRERSEFINPNATLLGGSALGILTENTRLARAVGTGVSVDRVDASLRDFENLSTWNRDHAFIAFFDWESQRRHPRPKHERLPNKLSEYMQSARQRGFAQSDEQFVSKTAPVFECLLQYASQIRDIHFYFLDTSEFLKEFSLQLLQPRYPAAWEPLSTEQYPWKLQDEASKLVRIVQPLRAWQKPPPELRLDLNVDDQLCKSPLAWEGKSPIPLFSPDASTPYPAALVAYSLAAVESLESGILYLSAWITQIESRPVGEDIDSRARQWYLVRAKLDLSHLATTNRRSLFSMDRLIDFERELTDEYAKVLRVGSAGSWKDLCERMRGDDLHSRIGRWLAFNYATARNYLFELQTPEVFQNWRDADQMKSAGSLAEDLEEATYLAEAADCYRGTVAFETFKRAWIGQFQLNVAQLRIARLPTLPESEVSHEKWEIQRLLASGAARLRSAAPARGKREGPVADWLVGRGPFDDQFQRIAGLKSILDRNKSEE